MKRAITMLFALGISLYALGVNPSGLPETEEAIQNWLQEYSGFEQNLGQVGSYKSKDAPDVLFRAKLPGYGVFINQEGVSYVLYQDDRGDTKSQCARIDLAPVNADISKGKIEYEDPLPGYANYYLPACPDGIRGVITYRKVRIKDVYPGVDWVWKFEDGRLHHEFEIEPYADLSKIKIEVKYADIEIKEEGKTVLFKTPAGTIEDGEISAWEGKKSVDVSYEQEKHILSFNVKNYSGCQKLIIDPPLSLLWGTYYGGSSGEIGGDRGLAITTDNSGNVFVTGRAPDDLPLYNPGGGAYFQGTQQSVDAFILKFNNSGVREWATYYGGESGDYGTSITADGSGNVFVAGYTFSDNFPTFDPGSGAYFQGTSPGWDDAFILKFSNSGVRQWATYYGGSDRENETAITSDNAGNIFVTGRTSSIDFPVYNPGGGAYFQDTLTGDEGDYDVFILKFSNSGIRRWATYYGGSGTMDDGRSIATDGAGNVFITGFASANDFPIYNPGGGAYFQGYQGGYDVFILKFSNSGVRQWATFYGGGQGDQGRGIAIDTSGNVFVTGNTASTAFPVYDPGGGAYFQDSLSGIGPYASDVFILEFNNSGVRQWATYYGGAYPDYGQSFAADASGNAFVTGYTSGDFPIYDPGGGAYFQGHAGGTDAFILKFANIGVRQWATCCGGNGDDVGSSITTDVSGNVFITGYAYSSDFPTYNPGGGAYFQGTNGGGYDAFIVKFETSMVPIFVVAPTNIDFGNVFIDSSKTDSATVTNTGSATLDISSVVSDNAEFTVTPNTGNLPPGGSMRFYITFAPVDTGMETGNIIFTHNGMTSPDTVTVAGNGIVGIEETKTTISPAVYAFSQNYPNPFKTAMCIRYQVPRSGIVTIAIYDVSGQHIRTLVNERKEAGYYSVRWNGRNETNKPISAGTYFCRMQTGEYSSVMKIVLMD
jgi:hypothetical protein